MEFHKYDCSKGRVKCKKECGFCRLEHWCHGGNGDRFYNRQVRKIDKRDICDFTSLSDTCYVELTDNQLEEIKKGEVFVLCGRNYNLLIGRA